MFQLINEFQNYDIKKKIKGKKYSQFSFFIYFGESDFFPPELFNESDIFTVIKYDNYISIIKDLNKYYHNDNAIHNQFELDIKRSHLYINGNKVINIEKINNYIDYSYSQNKNQLEIICTQSIFAPIIEWFYQSISEGYFIGELDISEKRGKTEIYLDKNNIHVIKNLRIFTITKNGDAKTHRYIKINILVNNYLTTNTIDYEIEFSKIFD